LATICIRPESDGLFCRVGFECGRYFRSGIFDSEFEEEDMSIHDEQPNRQMIEMTGAQRSVIPIRG